MDEAKRFRKLLACVSERILHGSQDEKHLGHEEELRLLEGWDCTFRTLIWPYNRYSKQKEPRIFCFNPTTREILKTNQLYIAVCKKCHESGGSIKPLFLPEPKQEVSKPTPKPKQVQRLCEDCKIPISKQPEHHKLCKKCWLKKFIGAKAPGDDGYGDGIPGSSVWLKKREQAARLQKLDERMKATKEE